MSVKSKNEMFLENKFKCGNQQETFYYKKSPYQLSIVGIGDTCKASQKKISSMTTKEIAFSSLAFLSAILISHYAISSITKAININFQGYQATVAKVAFGAAVGLLCSRIEKPNNK